MNKNLVFFIFILVCLIIFINKQPIKENFRSWKHDVFNTNNIINKNICLPSGNWIESCQIVDYRPPIIWADCKDFKGIYKRSAKNLSNCIAKNLSNIDGELQCDNY
jgi:hypothetical protein